MFEIERTASGTIHFRQMDTQGKAYHSRCSGELLFFGRSHGLAALRGSAGQSFQIHGEVEIQPC